MNLPIFAQRGLHYVSSALTVVAQRIPFVQHLAPLLSSPATLRVATPIATTFAGTHTLTGQTTFVVPLNGFETPTSTTVGQPFSWKFQTGGAHTATSYEVTGLPDGVTYTFGVDPNLPGLPGGRLEGAVTSAGVFEVTIVGYRFPNLVGNKTPPFTLTINATFSGDPFQNWRDSNWQGSDASNDLVSGPNADPDGDGIDNLLEYTLELDPNQAGVLPGTFGPDPDDNTQLLWEIPYFGTGNLTFEENDTLDPEGWTEVQEFQIETLSNTIQLRVPKTPGKKFLRMKATL